MIFKSYKYRLYPNSQQSQMIDKTIGVCRLIYNLAMEVKIRAYQEFGIKVYASDIQKDVKFLRKEYSWINEVNSQALYESIGQVDSSFDRFFSGSGFPKFKKKRNAGSFRCHNGARKIDFERSFLTIPKIKDIPVRISRSFEGKIRTITISKTTTNKYFASILVETTDNQIETSIPKNAIGIDLGIKDFAVLSDGRRIENQKHLRANLDRLKVLQRRASRKKKGSKNRNKANLKVSQLHEKITNQRNDFLHKLSTKLISDNQTDTIYIEDLAVKNMVKNHKLAQSISDVSWSEFVRQLEYKGTWYGKNVIKINRFFASSKTCSDCGHIKDQLSLSERIWVCSNCGVEHDRDFNAAINIRNSGLEKSGEPVELRTVVRAKKQEVV